MSRRKEIADALRREASNMFDEDLLREAADMLDPPDQDEADEHGAWIADALDRASDETEASIADVPWWLWVEKRQARIAVGYMRTLAHYIRNPGIE
jgi:hypothetical protein